MNELRIKWRYQRCNQKQ